VNPGYPMTRPSKQCPFRDIYAPTQMQKPRSKRVSGLERYSGRRGSDPRTTAWKAKRRDVASDSLCSPPTRTSEALGTAPAKRQECPPANPSKRIGCGQTLLTLPPPVCIAGCHRLSGLRAKVFRAWSPPAPLDQLLHSQRRTSAPGTRAQPNLNHPNTTPAGTSPADQRGIRVAASPRPPNADSPRQLQAQADLRGHQHENGRTDAGSVDDQP